MRGTWMRLCAWLSVAAMTLTMSLSPVCLMKAASVELGSYDYSSYDATGSIELDAGALWGVTDLQSAVENVRQVVSRLDGQELTSANVNVVRLDAEAAVARASTSSFEGTTLRIDAEQLKLLLEDSRAVAKALEEELQRKGIQIERNLSRTVTFLTDYAENWRILINIAPDIANVELEDGEISKIRVEVRKYCAITFDLAELQKNLKGEQTEIQIELHDKKQKDSSQPEFELQCVGGNVMQAVTLSLSLDGMAWENLKLIDRNATQTEGNKNKLFSSRNQGFNTMDTSSVISLESAQWITFAPVSVNFPDIDELDKKVKEAITELAKAGIVEGNNGKFEPDKYVTRGAFSKFVMGVMSKKYSEFARESTFVNPTFSDVYKTHKLYDYIEAAARTGYIKGYSDGTFKPANSITPTQMYAILGRIIKAQDGYKTFEAKYKMSPKSYLQSQFGMESVENISQTFWDDIAYATKRGLVIRQDNGKFCELPMNRGNTALILYNLLNKVR